MSSYEVHDFISPRPSSFDILDIVKFSEGIERPDISIGDKTYRFVTNAPLISHKPDFSLSHIDLEAYQKRFEQERVAASNRHSLFVEFVKRGFGIIPEKPATDSDGRDLTSNYYAYYEDTALTLDTSWDVSQAIGSQFPPNRYPFYADPMYRYDYHPEAELSQEALSELLDTVLAEDRFQEARLFSQTYLESQPSRWLR